MFFFDFTTYFIFQSLPNNFYNYKHAGKNTLFQKLSQLRKALNMIYTLGSYLRFKGTLMQI